MPRFEIYSGISLIGWSQLELGDAPMGVAFGRFLPAPGYAAIKAMVVAARGGPLPEELQLSIREHSNSEILKSCGGVHIADYSSELGTEGLEVSILGMPNADYEVIFHEHVVAYENHFKNTDK